MLHCAFRLVCKDKEGDEDAVLERDDGESLTLLQLLLTNLPKLIDLRCRTSNRPLNNLRPSPQRSARSNRVRCRQSLDLNDANPWVLWSSIMLAILQVAKPCFQGRRVVFFNRFSVSDDVGFARNRRPFTGGVQEGDVDFGFGFEVVGFAGFGVGVEE